MKFRPFTSIPKLQKGNSCIKWGDYGQENTNPDLACNRLRENVLKIGGKPKFQLSKKDSFFTIGSCFARGLEKTLCGKGLDVLSVSDKLADWRTSRENVTPQGATNRYNTASIANDFTWHATDSGHFPDHAYVQVTDELYCDPHMNPTLGSAPVAELKRRRLIWSEVFKTVLDADVVVLTLGMSEAWYDHKSELVCNSFVDARAVKRDRDRFSAVILSAQDNLHNLEAVHEILSQNGKPEVKIIVTVSPVPLIRTTTEHDIIVANQYSKSCLRTAAQEFADQHDNVAYFPSYEIAMFSNPELVWEPSDRRHVKGAFSMEIMKQFFNMYLGDMEFEKPKHKYSFRLG
ncbi:MAG TPA: hypothetical protein ENJ42_03255 [Hellea balneolensis]|uniref:GSCFA domain-containing protein n=1 Tax=Hellea balneolensis TaxID=287478 RepID=A0A7C5LST3_9PROT|nr:hypothetical protein [Hellea balneolensis]